MKSRNRNFRLSVIVPVYNVGNYLQQSLASISEQTLGFEKNIELILVNDGSTDNSANICRDYAEKYPDNVVYVEQKNQGVSVARNVGMKRVSGEYVTFFDGDDIWQRDAMKLALNFLDNHDSVDFVAFKIKFFDRIIDQHPYNFKFRKTRVVDVTVEPKSPIFHLPTCIFRADAIQGHMFDERLKISEDVKFLTSVLHQKQAYGVMSKSHYNYRKRQDNTSAIGGQVFSRDYYLKVPKLAYSEMMDMWSVDGKVHEFMQYEVLSDLAWRLEQKSQAVMTPNEESEYKDTIRDIVMRIDGKVILAVDTMDMYKKMYLMDLKHDDSWRQNIEIELDAYMYQGIKFLDRRGNYVHIDFMRKISSNRYEIEGYSKFSQISLSDELVVKVGDTYSTVNKTQRSQLEKVFLGQAYYDGGAFKVEIQLSEDADVQDIEFFWSEGNKKITRAIVQTGPYSGMAALPFSYSVVDSHIIRKEGGVLRAYRNEFTRRSLFELTYLGVICLNWRLRSVREQLAKLRRYNLRFLSWKERAFEVAKPGLIMAEAMLMIPRAIILRLIYRFLHKRSRRPLWLLSDRGMAAGDNGEALFRHILRRDDVYADVRFVISRKSKDYDRLQKLAPGKILDQDSFRYKVLFLLADKVISSQADVEVTNPFIRQYDHYADLLSFDFVFLQHGVIRHDLSEWLNRFNKNIALFVTSAEKERESILREPYHYQSDNVILTGLPRFDHLISEPKGKLILAPTYRKDLARLKTNKNGARPYDPHFKESAYFEYYNRLMNDERIVEVLEKNDMTGELYLHPVFAAQAIDFDGSDRFTVKEFPYDYATAFREGNLLVSDYSSVIFDFAYLKKPIIYTQFDRDKFFEGHLYKKSEFFSDQDDGFGPICHDYESTVAEIIGTIEGGSVMSSKYQERVDKFFYKTDKDNSQRVYEAIVNFDNNKYSTIEL